MPNPVITSSQLVTFAKTAFWDTYHIAYDAMRARLGTVMELALPSDRRTEYYGYFESAPYPKRWAQGETISSKNFKSTSFSVTNYTWGRRVEWDKADRLDDLTKSLLVRARDAGGHWATLEERQFFQILLSTVDQDLLPAIPLAPDGAALFAATVGGVARFGVTGGNIVATSGVASAAAIRTDLMTAMSRFRRFQDTEGQPLWDDAVLEQGVTVMFNPANLEVFNGAFLQRVNAQAITTAVSNAGVTNLILDSNIPCKLWPTQRITDNTWYIALHGAQKKAIFSQVREPLQEYYATSDNSDSVRDTRTEYVQWESRGSAGVAIPYGLIQVA
jgi:hypothetical protein